MEMTRMVFLRVIIITLSFYFCSCRVRNVKTTVATVICPHREFPYNCSIIEYRVNEKRYFSMAPHLKYMTKGDKFFMTYDSLNPVKQEIYMEYPVILPSEETLTIKGKILKCITGEYSKITYEYYVNDVRYKKLQVLRGFYRMKKGTECPIRVVKADPKRAKLAINP
ncbi:MAG: hypothetical protein ACXVNM_02230 [Bacteroidia bacterium]